MQEAPFPALVYRDSAAASLETGNFRATPQIFFCFLGVLPIPADSPSNYRDIQKEAAPGVAAGSRGRRDPWSSVDVGMEDRLAGYSTEGIPHDSRSQ